MKIIGLTQSSDLDEEVEIDNIEAKDEPSQQSSLFTAHQRLGKKKETINFKHCTGIYVNIF